MLDYKLEPIQDEESTKITIAWGYKVTLSQYRYGNIALTFIIFVLLVFGIFGLIFFWKKQKK